MRPLLTVAIVACFCPAVGAAQPRFADSSRYALSVSYGVFEYDLSGVGDVRMLAVRVERPVTKYVIAEGGILYARPHTEPGDATHYFVPELQVQVQLPLRVVSPYLGAGGGVALDLDRQRPQTTPPRNTRATDPTFSLSGGLRTWFTSAFGARAELRVRGIGGYFQGSSAEWTIGVALRL